MTLPISSEQTQLQSAASLCPTTSSTAPSEHDVICMILARADAFDFGVVGNLETTSTRGGPAKRRALLLTKASSGFPLNPHRNKICVCTYMTFIPVVIQKVKVSLEPQVESVQSYVGEFNTILLPDLLNPIPRCFSSLLVSILIKIECPCK